MGIRDWFRGARPADEREVREEIAFHIDRATQENLAKGMAPEQARAEALRRFGDLEKVRRECLAVRGSGVSPIVAWTAVAALATVSFLLRPAPKSEAVSVTWAEGQRTVRPPWNPVRGFIVERNGGRLAWTDTRIYGIRTYLSPFTEWRWRNGAPEVTTDGKGWFELVSAAGVPAATLREEYRVALALPEGTYLDGDPCLMIFGNAKCPGPSVEVVLRNLADGTEVREVCALPLRLPPPATPAPK